jgi:hypothetical protein
MCAGTVDRRYNTAPGQKMHVHGENLHMNINIPIHIFVRTYVVPKKYST